MLNAIHTGREIFSKNLSPTHLGLELQIHASVLLDAPEFRECYSAFHVAMAVNDEQRPVHILFFPRRAISSRQPEELTRPIYFPPSIALLSPPACYNTQFPREAQNSGRRSARVWSTIGLKKP
jgi:hypothetical protein